MGSFHGRPLRVNVQTNILLKMLCHDQDSDLAALSILGTHFQLNAFSSFVSSDLVSMSYALLTEYKPKSGVLWLSFPPEPFLSVLAASMMNPNFKMEAIYGCSKSNWVSKFGELLGNCSITD